MKNSWLIKLLASFLLIILVGGLVVSLLTSDATESAFSIYTTRSSQMWADRLTPGLVDFYRQSESWEGVDVYLATMLSGSSTSQNQSVPSGLGQGHGANTGFQPGSGGVMGLMEQHLILADQQGVVAYDSLDKLTNQVLASSELENGIILLSGDQQIGTLFISPEKLSTLDTAAAEFLTSVRKAIFSSALIAGIIALLLGVLLSIQITAPMRKLHKAASAIAKGDLDQRVDIKTRDEFGELGNTFNSMAVNLSKAEIQRQHLMADVAHELRTPLAAIQGTIEAMQDGVLPCDREQLEAIYSESVLLNRLIGDLRLLSLAETSQLKLELQPSDLNLLAQQAVDHFQSQAKNKNLSLSGRYQANLPALLLDSDRIAQVLNNLISNAITYSVDQNSIIVETYVNPSTDRICVSVTDSGPGIDANDLPHVFNRFYRADKSRSRSSGGSGLGLAIVKELVEAHGGLTRVESPVHEDPGLGKFGTRFVIEFPLK